MANQVQTPGLSVLYLHMDSLRKRHDSVFSYPLSFSPKPTQLTCLGRQPVYKKENFELQTVEEATGKYLTIFPIKSWQFANIKKREIMESHNRLIFHYNVRNPAMGQIGRQT